MHNDQTKAPKSGHGGARKGAGRPKTVARQVTVGLPQDALDILQQQPNKSAFVAEAIRHLAAWKAKHQYD